MNDCFGQETCYYQSAAITIIVLNIISLISMSFVLMIYIINWKKIASFPMRSFYLCLSCWGQNLYVILLNPILVNRLQTQDDGANTTSGYCIFQGILKVTFDLSSILWTTLIIYSVYASVVRNYSLESKEIFYLLFAYLLPLVAAVIPAFFSLYGYDTYFCWFDSDNYTEEFWLKMGFYYIPLWTFFIANIVLSQITYKKLKDLGLQNRELTIFKRLMLFPFILLITGVFSTANLLYQYIDNSFLEWLDFTGLFFISLYGCLNAIAYGFNPIIMEQIKIFLCKKKTETGEELDSSSVQRNSHSSYTSKNTERLEAQLFEVRASDR